jgi:hypothetical protein
MPITPTVEKWLESAGYEFHCFVSWTHTSNADLTACARTIKREIEQALALSIPNPKVFLDERILRVGDDWPMVLQEALCRSVSMVAICAPIYYRQEHKWCGYEWAAMQRLSTIRLPGEGYHAIIPILLKQSDPIPAAVRAIQYIDITHVLISGRRYYNTQEFRNYIYQIVDKIEKIAIAIAKHRAMADCNGFRFIEENPFADYFPTEQPLPFRSS